MGKGKKHIDQQSTGIGTCTPVISSPYSSSSSNLNKQVSATNRNEDVGASGFFSPSVFGNIPSVSEVEFAISVLRTFIQAVTSCRSESNWLVQMLDGHTSRILMACGLRRVYEAFQLLEIDPSVKATSQEQAGLTVLRWSNCPQVVRLIATKANLICTSVNFSVYMRKMNSRLPSFQSLRTRQETLEEPVFNKLTTIEETLTVHSLCLPNCQAREVALITATSELQ
ncbi:hypothetical protein TIFTF001_025469 [Ficus carica]|uniref:Uncharacterized protein n=1 Tax=Ficus carica TaxID=3494 RepID=A0AA88DE74_FICCA|nr:hypothetical protein TIFTF001_025469 [Ficus carica]